MEETIPLIGSIFIFFISISVIFFLIAAYWKIFEKAGKPGWAAIIPIYNFVVFLEIVGKPVWWVVLLFVPIANIVVLIWTTNMLSKSFGKDEGFTVGILLLRIVFIPILGFGDAKYQGPYGLRDEASREMLDEGI